jgi:4-hydroxy-4-methyl-2-oxoglutarate aldolase
MDIADRLHACHSSVVHDVMKNLGLQVLPDDHVLADRDGIVLIAAANVAEVVAAAEQKMATEGDMARAIRAGEDPQAAYLRFRVF